MRRDFTFIDDIVAGTLAALDRTPGAEEQAENGEPPHRLYNLGNNRPERLMDFIGEIEQACGRKAVLDMQPMQLGDVKETCADIEASARDLGFDPKTTIAEGVPRFVRLVPGLSRDLIADAVIRFAEEIAPRCLSQRHNPGVVAPAAAPNLSPMRIPLRKGQCRADGPLPPTPSPEGRGSFVSEMLCESRKTVAIPMRYSPPLGGGGRGRGIAGKAAPAPVFALSDFRRGSHE